MKEDEMDEAQFGLVNTRAATVPLAFIDTETTGLDRITRQVWDVGIIRRDPNGRRVIFSAIVADVDMRHADPRSLEIGRFSQRHPKEGGTPEPGTEVMREREVAEKAHALLDGCYLVGAVPWFDEHGLFWMMERVGLPVEPYHYHFVDVENLAAGQLQMQPPWDFDKLLSRYGIRYDERKRHTALGDAEVAEKLYDAVMVP